MASYTVIIPARMASTRLPGKPLADIGGVPMIVRVAQQAARSRAGRVIVASDSDDVLDVVRQAGFEAVSTSSDHATGTDRVAQVCALLRLADDHIIVNVQGDEPEMPPALIDDVADALASDVGCSISTAAYPIDSVADWLNPNAVKVVRDARGRAMYFSRAPIPWNRDHPPSEHAALPDADCRPLRHIGIYGYRARFLKQFSSLAPAPLEQAERLEQLRAMYHGHRIAVAIAASAPPAGVDTAEDLAAVRLRIDGART